MLEKYSQFVGRKGEINRLINAAKTSEHHNSVLFLSGQGGVGKTWLLEELRRQLVSDDAVLCTPILDMDDTSYHLSSSLCSKIAEALGELEFANYLQATEYYYDKERRELDIKRIYVHLRQSEKVFIEDYNRLTGLKRVVFLIDTFEAVQEAEEVLSFLSLLMRALQNTTFIFAGRHVNELQTRFKDFQLPVERIELTGLSKTEIDAFFDGIIDLSDEQKRKLALLTSGNPLLLCLVLDCYRHGYWLDDIDKKSLKEIEALISEDSDAARRFRYEFEKSLVVAYADTEPFRYFIRQLAHASRRVNKEIFKALIQFRSDAEADEWWLKLQDLPYVRKRASGDYISVHDVLRTLIFTHVIPIRDPDYVERKQIIQKLINCYDKILSEAHKYLQNIEKEFEQEARQQKAFVEQRQPVGNLTRLVTQRSVIERKIWILQSEVLHYQLNIDLMGGSRSFIQQFDEATTKRQLTLRQRLVSEIAPIVGAGLIPSGTKEHFELSYRLVRQQTYDGQTAEALNRVSDLLAVYSAPDQKARLLELRADCKLSLKYGLVGAIEDYRLALKLARKAKLPVLEYVHLAKQIGWCFRQLGLWHSTKYWYDQAQVWLANTKSTDRRTLQERASLFNNTAYVEAFCGNFDRAMDLGLRGIQYRIALNLPREQAMSYSTLGEICRYNRDFVDAISYYQKAEEIFNALNDRGWLGRLWQQEAICLLQMGGHIETAFKKAELAIEYCIVYNALAVPSAYNRAGRIVAVFPDFSPEKRFNHSLSYFETGIDKAVEIKDAWFFLANCIEALEAAQGEYERTEQSELVKIIDEINGRIAKEFGEKPFEARVKSVSYFPNLLGRHQLVLGNLDYFAGFPDNTRLLNKALQHYLRGFKLIARGFFGSYGLARMAEELDKLGARVIKLPRNIAIRWKDRFAKEWKTPKTHPTLRHFAKQVDDLINIRE